MDPPVALMPFSVMNSRLVSKLHRIEPSLVEKARSDPSFDPENSTPGIREGAEIIAALHVGPALHVTGSGGWNHARSPVARFTACSPPGVGVRMSDTGKYACS